MVKLSKYRVLLAGILASPIAAFLGLFAYVTLTRASADRNQDFVFRLSVVTLVMTVPFLLTLLLFIGDRRRNALTLSGKIGFALALLSLGLTWLPGRGLVARMHRNVATREARAPLFETIDIFGESHRLQDHLGEVVVINAWGTWCPPCKKEMPALDEMYQKRKNEGLIVFGLSTEDAELQRKFVKEQVHVTYPLLTPSGNVPIPFKKCPTPAREVQRGEAAAAPDGHIMDGRDERVAPNFL
jgi:thiol-disulfide isomerase/thioredoxin